MQTDLSSVAIQKVTIRNILIIVGDFNAHLGQNEGFKHPYRATTNRNGVMFKEFFSENNLICLPE